MQKEIPKKHKISYEFLHKKELKKPSKEKTI